MKRGAAILLLLTFTFFLAVLPWERCEASEKVCPPACHLLCADGCATVPLAEPPAALAPAPAALAVQLARVPAPGHHAYPPELPPPRV